MGEYKKDAIMMAVESGMEFRISHSECGSALAGVGDYVSMYRYIAIDSGAAPLSMILL